MNQLFKEHGVIWQFRNDHIWEQWFDSADQRDCWINRVGLVTHPDIVRITVRDGDNRREIRSPST